MRACVKFLFGFLLSCLSALTAHGQEDPQRLKIYADSLRFGQTGEFRLTYNDSFRQLLKTMLETENAMDINFDEINNTVSVLVSKDHKLKVISWVYVNDREEYANFCVVLYRKKPSVETSVFWLQDRIEPKADSLYTDFPPDFWPGALYYQLYDFTKKGRDYYCVLGLNGKTSFNNRKIIDVLWVDKEGELHIGAPVFYSSEKDYTPQYRVFFDYADASTMFLRFEVEEKLIAFSNLVPSNPEKLGMRQYYIPDGRIDFYKLKKKGKWVKYEGSTDMVDPFRDARPAP
jgi:hypothetical protein